MTQHLVDEIEFLQWPTPYGLSAYAAPFVIDLRYDAERRATIDASYSRLEDYPSGLDRFGVLQGPDRAAILKAALARRSDFLALKGEFGGFNLALYEPGIDEVEFHAMVARFVKAWRRKNGVE